MIFGRDFVHVVFGFRSFVHFGFRYIISFASVQRSLVFFFGHADVFHFTGSLLTSSGWADLFHESLYMLLSGGLVLGAFFMATDYVTSPLTTKGKLLFGMGCGILTFLIRYYGNMAEGVSFSIILMNILTPHIDDWTMGKPFGEVKENG